jgi:hypothetical protein
MKRNYHVIGLACFAALASSASWAGPDQRLVQPGTDITMAPRAPLRATTTMTDQTAGISSGEYARLSARWWQWALSGPDGRNAVQDETGKLCGLRGCRQKLPSQEMRRRASIRASASQTQATEVSTARS